MACLQAGLLLLEVAAASGDGAAGAHACAGRQSGVGQESSAAHRQLAIVIAPWPAAVAAAPLPAAHAACQRGTKTHASPAVCRCYQTAGCPPATKMSTSPPVAFQISGPVVSKCTCTQAASAPASQGRNWMSSSGHHTMHAAADRAKPHSAAQALVHHSTRKKAQHQYLGVCGVLKLLQDVRVGGGSRNLFRLLHSALHACRQAWGRAGQSSTRGWGVRSLGLPVFECCCSAPGVSKYGTHTQSPARN